MKYLRKFDSVSDMETALANSTIGVIGLAYESGNAVIQNKPTPPDPTIPFYVENITDSDETLTIAGYDEGKYLEFSVEYSTDGTNWESFGTTGETPLTKSLEPGGKVYLRAQTDSWNKHEEYYEVGCYIEGVSKVGGNIMSLLYGSGFTGNETSFPNGSVCNFATIFGLGDTTHLRNASELILPATTLTTDCYVFMFSGCTSLATAPKLPATTLANHCYGYMFENCTSLTAAPELLIFAATA